ncbi:hypothetical protein CI105_04480 [Candidatus Izimaplasma bacterium ZiA1]|uniref:deoxyribodipyrimidine photo-lyase n=1 Tax=Candidatus Izimoplasma sp. ZiA1 TaxID=2024899 RepID=UPI000BAA3E4D|nr:hypothetical protein CI105_04480 [Candidatus Izimaplasma bacterium ZiA1]
MNNLKTIYPSRFFEVLNFDNKGTITYLMSDAFRIHYNHGLLKAINMAKELSSELQIILFRQKEANERNNKFFNEGIRGFKGFLSKYSNNIFYFEETSNQFYDLLKKSAIVFKDRAYLKEHLLIENEIENFLYNNQISFTLVESNVLVPVISASNKEEYSARTIRPKIKAKIEYYNDYIDILAPNFYYEQTAKDILRDFIDYKLKNYVQRNDPSTSYTSELSPYLKYGFISPLYIYNEVAASGINNASLFLEELVIRRELSYNFVFYNNNYHTFTGITYEWAYQSMNIHINDKREYLYTIDDYINFKTHDIYFNTAMKEMVYLGKMHGYMRMYWAKKIIQWSKTYQEAYQTIIYLNNYYFLDGNTPNGYCGVAWVFGKHDRAWKDRDIFGKIRYMNQAGLKRKFNIDKYVSNTNKLII